MYIFGNLTITNRQTMILLTKNRFLIIGTGFAAVDRKLTQFVFISLTGRVHGYNYIYMYVIHTHNVHVCSEDALLTLEVESLNVTDGKSWYTPQAFPSLSFTCTAINSTLLIYIQLLSFVTLLLV